MVDHCFGQAQHQGLEAGWEKYALHMPQHPTVLVKSPANAASVSYLTIGYQ